MQNKHKIFTTNIRSLASSKPSILVPILLEDPVNILLTFVAVNRLFLIKSFNAFSFANKSPKPFSIKLPASLNIEDIFAAVNSVFRIKSFNLS